MYIFVALCALLSLGVMLLGCRLVKMRKIQVPIADGKRALTAYYLVFYSCLAAFWAFW